MRPVLDRRVLLLPGLQMPVDRRPAHSQDLRDLSRRYALGVHPPGLPQFGCGHHRRPAAEPAPRAGCCQAGQRALPDQPRLGQSREHVEHQPAARGRGVDRFLQRPEAHPALVQLPHRVDQVPK